MGPKEDLKRELQDPEFAKFYGADHAKIGLAFSLIGIRGRLGLSKEELATKLGVSRAYIARLESGKANPTIGKAGSMFALLGFRIGIEKTELIFSVEEGGKR